MAGLTRSQTEINRDQHIRFRLGEAATDAAVSAFPDDQKADLPPMLLDAAFASAAQAADATTLVGNVPKSGTVTEVRLQFATTFTGAATDTRTFTLYAVAANGTLGPKVAEAASVGASFTSTANEGSVVLPILNGAVTKGQGLKLVSTHIGAGLAHSAGVITVAIAQ